MKPSPMPANYVLHPTVIERNKDENLIYNTKSLKPSNIQEIDLYINLKTVT